MRKQERDIEASEVGTILVATRIVFENVHPVPGSYDWLPNAAWVFAYLSCCHPVLTFSLLLYEYFTTAGGFLCG